VLGGTGFLSSLDCARAFEGEDGCDSVGPIVGPIGDPIGDPIVDPMSFTASAGEAGAPVSFTTRVGEGGEGDEGGEGGGGCILPDDDGEGASLEGVRNLEVDGGEGRSLEGTRPGFGDDGDPQPSFEAESDCWSMAKAMPCAGLGSSDRMFFGLVGPACSLPCLFGGSDSSSDFAFSGLCGKSGKLRRDAFREVSRLDIDDLVLFCSSSE